MEGLGFLVDTVSPTMGNVETVTICESTSYIIVSDRIILYFRNQIIIVY